MEDIAEQRDGSPEPVSPGPGASRAGARAESRFYVGVVAMVALLIGAALGAFALLPQLFPGWASVGISSGSMSPALRVGDVVVIAPTDGADLGRGTIITFRDAAGGLTTHRIDEIRADGSYVTKGDANAVADAIPVEAEQVVGAGRWVIPYVALPGVWLGRGDLLRLGLLFLTAATALWFARYAIDPRHDPWRRRLEYGPAASRSSPAGPSYGPSAPVSGPHVVHPTQHEE